jgi:hypothetical protein
MTNLTAALGQPGHNGPTWVYLNSNGTERHIDVLKIRFMCVCVVTARHPQGCHRQSSTPLPHHLFLLLLADNLYLYLYLPIRT